MKRILALCAPLAFIACGGTGQLDLQLTHDGTQVTNAFAGGPTYATITSTALGIPVNFDTGVAAIEIPVSEVDVHISSNDAGDLVDPAKDVISNNDGAWHTVVSYGSPVTYDLASLTYTAEDIGAVELPTGKVTQIRVRIAAQDLPDPDSSILPNAVTLGDGVSTCDLVLPRSAVSPGIEIDGVFEAIPIRNDANVTAVVNLELNEQLDETFLYCTYRLNPVLKIKLVDAR